ncbi:MAG TPA: TetR/AcrR family transcriptional regulator [Pseudonocardia sp.]|jgi:AcrR family transcriptional regulator|nr:TetR/AcrR family transcriptional regulator [Pseudonocardia sp.]
MFPPERPRGRKRSPHTHQTILDATIELLRTLGYEKLSIDKVAAHAGVSKATIYRRWPDKTHLVIEALGHIMGEPLKPSGDTATDIRAVVQYTIEIIGDLLGEVFLTDLTHNPQAARQLADLVGPYRAAHAAVLLTAAAHGQLPYDLDSTTVLDLIGGIVLYRKLTHRPLDETLADQLTELLLTGTIPRTPPSHSPDGASPPAPERPRLED